jgi:hypothetical protein
LFEVVSDRTVGWDFLVKDFRENMTLFDRNFLSHVVTGDVSLVGEDILYFQLYTLHVVTESSFSKTLQLILSHGLRSTVYFVDDVRYLH